MKLKIISLLIFLTGFFSVSASIITNELKVEGMKNPLGIDVLQPRFSWKIEATTERNVYQKAYQILVAASAEKLNNNEGDIWNSGKVSSSEQLWISFNGKNLKSNTDYFWKVKVWTTKGESSWSETSHWSEGLLQENDWKAQWIGLDKAMPWDRENVQSRLSARYLRKEIETKKIVKRAYAYISGLGLYELYINGNRVGDQVLAPSPTDYRKTVYYNTYNVTSLVKNGKNALGVILGNGRFYDMRQNYKTYKIPTFGYPKLRFSLKIDYSDGTSETYGSDASWKITADGPIRSNNEYNGEEYDTSKELTGWNDVDYNDENWMEAQRVGFPMGILRSQPMQGMKVVDKIKPLSITPLGNKFILDLGQNMAGWLRINVHGNKGDSVILRFAETLQKNGELYTENLRDARATDIYILKGDKNETWAPRFVYHGFRFVEISGLRYSPSLDDFSGEVVNDEMENSGTIRTSNDVLNQVLKNAWWGIRSNYKGMPVDCPQRDERQPWLGDRTMGCWGESYLFDNNLMYSKWGNDICDAQRYDGCIPDIAPPFYNYYTDNVTWPMALLMLCDMNYTQFSDKKPIVESYDAIKKWMKHIEENYMTENYIITKDEYGDWCVPPESLELIHAKDPKLQTDGKLISTAYYYQVLQLMQRFAKIKGDHKDDILQFSALSEKIKQSFNENFFNKDSLFYGNNTTTSNLLPLSFGMIPKQYVDTVCKQIIKNVTPDNSPLINTGVIGTQWLLRGLSKMGRADVAYTLASNDKYPSWGYMVANGATTIWELWNGNTASPKMNSGNHVMLLGDLLPFVYENLGGMKSDKEKTAFKQIIMKPNFDIPDLENVDASYVTPYGKVTSKWTKTLMKLHWEISVPVNTTAQVYLPDGKIKKIGSGSYIFDVDFPQRKNIITDEFLYEKASFPQCHASTIVELPNGDLLSAFFGGTREGAPDVCIYTCRKEKNSTKWSAPQLVADGILSPDLRKACYNPVLFQMPGGMLFLFYKIGNKVSDWTGYLKTSNDGGHNWSKAFKLPDGYLGPIKNKPVMVDNKIIAPSSTEVGGWKVHFEIAEDRGRKTHIVGPISASEAVLTEFQGKQTDTKTDAETGESSQTNTVQAIQPSILTYKDGRLQILCRTRNGKIATSWSTDRGETWSPLTLTDLPNNNSGTDAVTLKDGRQVLVYNAVATLPGAKKGPRTPLNVAISTDGIHWKNVLTLEDSPISQYSYPSIIQGSDGRIHIVYTWRRQRIKYVEIKL